MVVNRTRVADMAKKRARIEEEEGEAGEKVEGTPVKKKSKLGNAAGKPLSKLLDLLDAESSLLAGPSPISPNNRF